MKEVTAAIILRDGNILIAQRGKNENLEGKWELPGGKIEAGETPQQCLKREIFEELNVEVEIGDYFGESIYKYPDGEIRLLAYFAKIIKGKIKLSVHTEVKWVSIKDMDKYDFAPADRPLIEKIKTKIVGGKMLK